MAKLLTHQLLGVAVAYYVLRPQNIIQAFLYGGLALIGSMVPDLDGLRGHRTVLHNIFAFIFTGIIVYIVLLMVDCLGVFPVNMYPDWSSAAYVLAYLSHLLADIPTGTGVALFYPISKRRLGVLGLKYDNVVYNGLLMGVATLLLYVFFTSAPTPYNIVRDWFSSNS